MKEKINTCMCIWYLKRRTSAPWHEDKSWKALRRAQRGLSIAHRNIETSQWIHSWWWVLSERCRRPCWIPKIRFVIINTFYYQSHIWPFLLYLRSVEQESKKSKLRLRGKGSSSKCSVNIRKVFLRLSAYLRYSLFLISLLSDFSCSSIITWFQ